MKHGDFTALAKNYVNRTGYSMDVIDMLAKYTGVTGTNNRVADVGAGTGKLTENLAEYGISSLVAVEPNEAMRGEGIRYTERFGVEWREGSGEQTGLGDSSCQWLLMASSFHWVDPEKGLAEFSRVLQPGGYFTALWNPRDLVDSDIHKRIESCIYKIVPDIKRVSSGSSKYTEDIRSTLLSTGHFKNVVFTEGYHEVEMTQERYLNAWRSVNDIQVQAGPERWEEILVAIAKEIESMPVIVVPYKTRAWTVQKV
jgi:ubiquinone/menaquinone biosynthesis C-methylase UbiE